MNRRELHLSGSLHLDLQTFFLFPSISDPDIAGSSSYLQMNGIT